MNSAYLLPLTANTTTVRELRGEVEYTADADALEFIQSQTMTDADLAEVEQAFAAAEAAADRVGEED